jgi:hypothetical protein
MTHDFSSIYNHHERLIFQAVTEHADSFPDIVSDENLLVDVACVALNRLPPRYIRHQVDFVFYLTDRERREMDLAVKDAVGYAFEFVKARAAMNTHQD